MSEAEAFELAMLAEANAITSFTIYITFTFGYLAAAFLAGKRLTKAQALIVSGLYVFSALSATLNFLSDLDYQAKAFSYAPSVLPEGTINDPLFWRFYMSLLFGSGIIASLYFMWSIRRNDDT